MPQNRYDYLSPSYNRQTGIGLGTLSPQGIGASFGGNQLSQGLLSPSGMGAQGSLAAGFPGIQGPASAQAFSILQPLLYATVGQQTPGQGGGQTQGQQDPNALLLAMLISSLLGGGGMGGIGGL